MASLLCSAPKCSCDTYVSKFIFAGGKCATCKHPKDKHVQAKSALTPLPVSAKTSLFASPRSNVSAEVSEWQCLRKWVKIDPKGPNRTGGTIEMYCSGVHIDFKRPKGAASNIGWWPRFFIWDGQEGWSNPKMDEKEATPLHVYREIMHALGAITNENGEYLTKSVWGGREKVCEKVKELNVFSESNIVSMIGEYATVYVVIRVLAAGGTQLLLRVEIDDKVWDWKVMGDARSEVYGPYVIHGDVLQRQLELALDVPANSIVLLNAKGKQILFDSEVFKGQPIFRSGRPFLMETNTAITSTSTTNMNEEWEKGRGVDSLSAHVTCSEGWSESEHGVDSEDSFSFHFTDTNPHEEDYLKLSQSQREVLCALWSADALAEHASIASFARFTLQLLALGAPSDLLTRSQQAGKDEIEHAKLCFQLARRFGGHPAAPSSFPFPLSLQLEQSPSKLARAVVLEGCVCETASLFELVECLSGCTDHATTAALRVIIKDEIQHVVLAWKTVLWLLQHKEGAVDAVRQEVAVTFDNAIPAKPQDEISKCASWLRGYGRLPVEHATFVRDLAVWRYVRPLALHMLKSAPVSLDSSCGLLAQQAFQTLVEQIFG